MIFNSIIFSQIVWIASSYFAVGLKLGNNSLDAKSLTLSILGYSSFVYVYLYMIKEFTFKVDNINRSKNILREAVEDLDARGETDPEVVRLLLRDVDNLEPVSGYGLFGIDRTTITSMVSTALTYLVILIQFKTS